MKTIKSYILLALATFAISLVSCDNPTYITGGDGGNGTGSGDAATGEVSLASMSVSVNVAESEIETRATSTDVSTFTVNIKDADGNVTKTYIYSEMPELVALPVGTYTVEAYNAELQDAAFESPYLYGTSGSFTVKANEITTVDPIVCTLGNVKVGVFYSDELAAVLGDDVVVAVTVGDNATLNFSATETRSGYFKVASDGGSTLVATFTGTVDGYTVNDYKVLTSNVVAGNYLKITFSLKDAPVPPDENGQVGSSGLNMDATVNRVDISGNTDPGDEEIIEPDDYLTVERSTVNFTCDESSMAITVSASGTYTATSDASWCTISNLTATGFTINATANSDASNDRTAVVTVAMGSIEKTITVTQAKYSEASTAPSFSSDYIDLTSGAYNDVANFGSGANPAVVVISAPKGIKTAHVIIDSEKLTPSELEGVGLRSAFELTTALADDGTDLSTPLGNLGFPIKENILDKTEATFDITTFVPLLGALGSGKSTFILEVTDNEGQTSTAYLRFEKY